MIIINFKNYEEISDKKSLQLAKVAAKVSKKTKVKIIVCPPQHMISEVAKIPLDVYAQHLDNSHIGSTTGFLIPELVIKSGIAGSLINHSEHRIPAKDIEELVGRLKKLEIKSVVCVQDAQEAAKYSKFNPDYIAIEPPELIGSGKAVSKEKPEIITSSVKAISGSKNKTKLLCGAGIVTGEDVSSAIKLGAKGILVASGIVKAKDWEKSITEFAKSFLKQ